MAWTKNLPERERPAFIDDVLDRYGRLDDVAGDDVRVFRFYQMDGVPARCLRANGRMSLSETQVFAGSITSGSHSGKATATALPS